MHLSYTFAEQATRLISRISQLERQRRSRLPHAFSEEAKKLWAELGSWSLTEAFIHVLPLPESHIAFRPFGP